MKPPRGMRFENVTVDLACNETRWIMSIESVIHRTPPPGQAVTPCCEHTLFELPVWDRMTSDPAAVTCEETNV